MKFKLKEPPRAFEVGRLQKFVLKDCAAIELKPDEQVTFVTESGAEYDVARKEWGFYATPSLNGRLPQFGLRGALIKNEFSKKFYLVLVERNQEKEFRRYLQAHDYRLICWMDEDESLKKIEQNLKESHG